MEYVLKIRKRNFESLMNGDLTFVIHKVDRLYCVGDRLVLFETEGGNETGRSLTVRITYIMHAEDAVGIKDDYCVVSVKRSGKNTRTNVGNRPASEDEAVEYAAKLGKSADCARRFYNYYSMTGWKMKSGLPLSDWHAALRKRSGRGRPRLRSICSSRLPSCTTASRAQSAGAITASTSSGSTPGFSRS